MISTYKHEKLIWIDAENPTKDEIRELMDTYGIHPEIAEDLIDPTIRARADAYKEMLYFVFHFPQHTYQKNKSFDKRSEEIDFVIGKNFIITVHYAPIDTLITFSRAFETSSLLHNQETKTPAHIFVDILYTMYKSIQERVEDIQTTLNMYEEDIFSGKEREMVLELSLVNRVLIYFRDCLLSQKRALDVLGKTGSKMFDHHFEVLEDKIMHEYNKTERRVSLTKEYAGELRKTNDSLLSTKQNEIMKTLTVVNFIILPLSVITGLFGMNVESTPLSGNSYDFWIVVLLMAIITFISTLIFKRKNWL
jgi:magnesium transporter